MSDIGNTTTPGYGRWLDSQGAYEPLEVAYCDICGIIRVVNEGDICPDCRIDYCCVQCGANIGEGGKLCNKCRRSQLEELSAKLEDYRDGLREEKALGDARAILTDLARQWGRP